MPSKKVLRYKRNRERGRRLRSELLEAYGNKCQLCNYSEEWALQFHHVEKKFFSLNASTIAKRSEKEVWNEVSKCVLLCSNCHIGVHAGRIRLT